MTKRPPSSVVAVRDRPVETFCAVTVAPGRTACCASVTTPSRANVGFWANAARSVIAQASTSIATPNRRLQGLHMDTSAWLTGASTLRPDATTGTQSLRLHGTNGGTTFGGGRLAQLAVRGGTKIPPHLP